MARDRQTDRQTDRRDVCLRHVTLRLRYEHLGIVYRATPSEGHAARRGRERRSCDRPSPLARARALARLTHPTHSSRARVCVTHDPCRTGGSPLNGGSWGWWWVALGGGWEAWTRRVASGSSVARASRWLRVVALPSVARTTPHTCIRPHVTRTLLPASPL